MIFFACKTSQLGMWEDDLLPSRRVPGGKEWKRQDGRCPTLPKAVDDADGSTLVEKVADRFEDAIARFQQLLGTNGVLRGVEETFRYSRDWSGDYSGMPVAVVRPSDAAGVAGVLQLCRENG